MLRDSHSLQRITCLRIKVMSRVICDCALIVETSAELQYFGIGIVQKRLGDIARALLREPCEKLQRLKQTTVVSYTEFMISSQVSSLLGAVVEPEGTLSRSVEGRSTNGQKATAFMPPLLRDWT